MKQRAFKAALKELGLTQLAAATKLGVPGGKARISEWERGKRPIPPYIAAHVETLLYHNDPPLTSRESGSEGARDG